MHHQQLIGSSGLNRLGVMGGSGAGSNNIVTFPMVKSDNSHSQPNNNNR